MSRSQLGVCFVALLTCFASGCGPSAASRLMGKWELDINSTDVGKKIDEAAAGNPLAGMMAGAMKGMAQSVKVEFEFKSGGQVATQGSVMGISQSKTGTWRVTKASGNDVTIALKLDGDSAEKETTVTFVDNDTISMIPPTGGPSTNATFRRVKPAAK